MKNPSAELVHVPKPPVPESGAFVELFTELSSSVSQSIDLTGVFNKHENAADAEASIALVPDQSLVFIEGYNSKNENNVGAILEGLSSIHLAHGVDSEEYRTAKSDIQLTLATVDYEKDEGSFLENYIAQAQLLVAKDCVIYTADETGLFPNKREGEAPDTSAYSDPVNSPDWSVGKFAKIIEWYSRSQYIFHHQRERHAVISTVLKTSDILEAYPDNNLTKTADGKLKAFILYGTNHRDSMGTAFQERGIAMTPVTMHTPDYRLLPKDYQTFNKDARRQVAIDVITNLSFKGKIQFEEMDELLASSYDGLETLNKDPEAYKKFMVRAAQIHYLFAETHKTKLESDRIAARQQLLNFLTETPGWTGDMLVDEDIPATFATDASGVTNPVV